MRANPQNVVHVLRFTEGKPAYIAHMHPMVLDSRSNEILGDKLSLPLVADGPTAVHYVHTKGHFMPGCVREQTWVLGDVRPITSTRCATLHVRGHYTPTTNRNDSRAACII